MVLLATKTTTNCSWWVNQWIQNEKKFSFKLNVFKPLNSLLIFEALLYPCPINFEIDKP